MKYKIKTVNATQKLAAMISCVKNGKDQSEKEIDLWKLIINTDNEELFVHTPDQWEKKCCIECKIEKNDKNDTIIAKFYYFKSVKNEDRNQNYDEGIILGRFTELLLTHFVDLDIKIEIEP